MSIYKNNNPLYSDKALLRTGENAMYQVFQVKDQWIIRFIKTIIFLILGGIALPLRLVFRRKIGERSVGLVTSMVAIGLFTYIVLGTFLGIIPLEGWDKWTGEKFELNLNSRPDYHVYIRDIWEINNLPLDTDFINENGERERFNFKVMSLKKHDELAEERRKLLDKVAKENTVEDELFPDIENLSDREKKLYSLPLPLQLDSACTSIRYFYRSNPISLVYLYLGFFWFFLSIFFGKNFGLKMPRLKWHSYHRGLSFLNLIFSVNQTLIWMIEAVLFLFIGWWFTSFELIQWRLLGTVILIQAFALFIEEYAIHKRKREAILNMIDHEIESRMIAEQRLTLVDVDGERSSQVNDKMEVASIN